eukprot:scaffold43891_cov65-Phaeocystis_antarctica.AAC.1
MVSRTKDRARDPLSLVVADATRPGHAVNMLTEERLCKRRSGAASMQLYGGCAPLPRLLFQIPEPQSSQILRAACAKPSAQSLGDARTCVSSYGIRHQLAKVLKKSWVHIVTFCVVGGH